MAIESTALEEWKAPHGTTEEKVVPVSKSLFESLNAVLGYDVRSIGHGPGSTTDAILTDPVWSRRLAESRKESKAGQRRPIEDYWAESD